MAHPLRNPTMLGVTKKIRYTHCTLPFFNESLYNSNSSRKNNSAYFFHRLEWKQEPFCLLQIEHTLIFMDHTSMQSSRKAVVVKQSRLRFLQREAKGWSGGELGQFGTSTHHSFKLCKAPFQKSLFLVLKDLPQFVASPSVEKPCSVDEDAQCDCYPADSSADSSDVG